MLRTEWIVAGFLLPGWLAFTNAHLIQLRADEPSLVLTKEGSNGANQGERVALTDLSPAQFAKFHAFLRPRAKEMRFGEIPWMFDLWAARKKAAAEGKPLLILAASGNPCGTC